MHKGKEAIRAWLYEQGYPSIYTVNGVNIEINTEGDTEVIEFGKGCSPMRQAIEFVISDAN